IAVDHIDVLADGASATYGADAVSGVVNIIMKRGYNGAMTQVSGGYADGMHQYQAAQLFGRTWGSGDITLSYEYYYKSPLAASKRPNQLTTDFTPWGLDDLTSIRSSLPGVVSVGAPSSSTGTSCTNCFSIPKGQNGVGLTWGQLQANPGVKNEV